MLYDLKNELDRQRFATRAKFLFDGGRIVELTEKKPLRSIPQNRYLHLLLGWFAKETGNTLEYVKREYFKRLCNRDLFVGYKDDPYLGRIEVIRSSAEIDSGQMTTAIERFRNWSSAEGGIYLPSPNEEAFLQSIEIELQKYKGWI